MHEVTNLHTKHGFKCAIRRIASFISYHWKLIHLFQPTYRVELGLPSGEQFCKFMSFNNLCTEITYGELFVPKSPTRFEIRGFG